MPDDLRPLVLVATPGGHLHELYELARRLPRDQPRVWITGETPQSISLLRGENLVAVPQVGTRQAARALASLPQAVSLMGRLRPCAVISTGAALSVPYLLAARLRGIPTHYIESVTRVTSPSVTGRMMALTPGVELHHQGLHSPGRRWHFVGNSLDNFVTQHDSDDRHVKRIFVTVGSERFPFARLLSTVSAALPHDAEVVWQTGHTEIPATLQGTAKPWFPYADMVREIDRADVVISHAGVGSVLTTLSRGVMPIVLARSSQEGEHVDDHQQALGLQLKHLSLAVDLDGQHLHTALREAASRRVHARVAPPLSL